MSTKQQPRLSVITPVYNGADFIKETLSSLLASDYENIEFIVLDDGSKDESAAIAETVLAESGRSYRLVRKQNSGEADTDNLGLSMASGEYIAIVNCDDPVYPSLFSKSVHLLEQNPGAVVTYPDWDMIDEHGRTIKKVQVKEFSLDSLLGDNECLPGPGAVIRRAAITDPVLRDPRFRYTSDYRQWLNLSLKGSFMRIPEFLCTFRIHSSQQTAQAAGLVQAREMIGCITDFYSQAGLPQSHLKLRSQSFSQAYYLAAVQSLHRRGVPGRRFLFKSLTIPYRRASGYAPSRRSPYLALLIALNPLGRQIINLAKKIRGF